mmetsp:Transcript_41798/g.87737  ORF Transcript_41798/g.87737 Transcript_41798/m.87737 type:complete len:676 (+) Transcript_41798:110-2137(+)
MSGDSNGNGDTEIAAAVEPSANSAAVSSKKPLVSAEPPRWRFVADAKKSSGYSSLAAGQYIEGKTSEELGAKYVAPDVSLYEAKDEQLEVGKLQHQRPDDKISKEDLEVGKFHLNDGNDDVSNKNTEEENIDTKSDEDGKLPELQTEVVSTKCEEEDGDLPGGSLNSANVNGDELAGDTSKPVQNEVKQLDGELDEEAAKEKIGQNISEAAGDEGVNDSAKEPEKKRRPRFLHILVVLLAILVIVLGVLLGKKNNADGMSASLDSAASTPDILAPNRVAIGPSSYPSTSSSYPPSYPRAPSLLPTNSLTMDPTHAPSASPTKMPTTSPTLKPSASPTKMPTTSPTLQPSASPTKMPTPSPTLQPSASPSKTPTGMPSRQPSKSPTYMPSLSPSKTPSNRPTTSPSKEPTAKPTEAPTDQPTNAPSRKPSRTPTPPPTNIPTSERTCSTDGKPFQVCLAINMSGSLCNGRTGALCIGCPQIMPSSDAEESYCRDMGVSYSSCCNNFATVKALTSVIVNWLGDLPAGKSFSVVEFASDARVVSGLSSTAQTLATIGQLTFSGGLDNHASAIQMCQQTLSSSSLEKRVIVLITDGETGVPDHVAEGATEAAAYFAKADGIFIIPVLVSPDPPDTNEGATTLLSRISSDGQVFDFTDNNMSSARQVQEQLLNHVSCLRG